MRVIAGEYKGRKLESPENYDIRPTADKVKEALFSIISPDIAGAVCVDLFSGTGNLGIEALSRGAERCYFCDNSRISLGLIKRNLEHCKAEGAVVAAGDFRRVLEKIKEREEKVDIFLVDPPYEAGLYEDVFSKIRELELLSEDGVIVAEHGKYQPLPDELYGFQKYKERKYGHVSLSIYG